MVRAKILWGEGLFLRPQHFQHQDAYLESLVRHAMLSAQPYCWGVRTLAVDHDALASGVLRFVRAELIFKDGETYSAPDHDLLPPPLALDAVEFDGGIAEFHLALPHLRDHGDNCGAADDGVQTRFAIHPREMPDRFTDALQAEVLTLKKRGLLRSATQTHDAYACLPILRVHRTAAGGYECDADFIPPSLHLNASPALVRQLQYTLDALQAKAQALSGLHREASRHVIEHRSGDVASFWLQHTVNTGFAALAHLLRAPLIHPERFFHELLRLAGGLLTFSTLHELSDLPAYDHAAPGPAFRHLDRLLRSLLDTVISTRYFGIALTERSPGFHAGHLNTDRITDETTFYLAVSCSLPLPEIIESVPLRIKVGAPDDVDKLVLSALGGVRLTHAAQLPQAIPVRAASCYFALDRNGTLYERMLKARTVTIYAPDSYHDLTLELIALT